MNYQLISGQRFKPAPRTHRSPSALCSPLLNQQQQVISIQDMPAAERVLLTKQDENQPELKIIQDSVRFFKCAADQAKKVSAKREFMVKVLRRQTAKQFPRSHALLEDIDPEAETLTRFMGMITSENEVIYAEVERLQAAVVQQEVQRAPSTNAVTSASMSHKVMLAKVNANAHRHSFWNESIRLRDLGMTLVVLSLRLGARATQRRSRYLDIESDPALEAAALRVTRDGRVKALVMEQLELLIKLGELQGRLSGASLAGYSLEDNLAPALVLEP